MLPFHEIPDPRVSPPAIVRGVRWIVRAIGHSHLEGALSWLVWLVAVGVFAIWTLTHNPASDGAAWIGPTIHIGVFAIWALVAREWLGLRMRRRSGRPPDRYTNAR